MLYSLLLFLASITLQPSIYGNEFDGSQYFVINNDTVTNQSDASSTCNPELSEVKELVDGVVGYRENGLWGLQNSKGETITQAKYSSVEKINRYIKASIIGKTSRREFYGVITTEDEIVIPFEYVSLKEGGDRVIAIHQSGRKLNFGLISYSNNVLVPFEYYDIRKLSRNRFAVENYEGKIALFNDSGKKLTSFDIDSIGQFEGNYAKIYSNGALGLLEKDGAVKVEASYKEISISKEITIQSFPVWERYDKDSRKKLDFVADMLTPVQENFILLKRNNLFQLINSSGSRSKIYNFIDVKAPNAWHVQLHGKHGVVDSSGHEVVPMIYDSIRVEKEFVYAFYDGEGSMTGWNILDIYGSQRSRFVYQEVGEYSDGLFPIKRNGKWGFMNRSGKEVIYCVYDSISVFSRDMITVSFHGESGVIDRKGNWIITPRKGQIELIDREYFLLHTTKETRFYKVPDELIYFTQYPIKNVDGYLLEKVDSGTFWQIDYDGVRIQESSIDDMYPIYKDSVYVINDRGKVGLRIRGRRDVYFSPDYQELFPPSEGFMRVKVDNRYGFVDFDGKLRIAHRYELASDFKDGLAAVKILGKWGFINKQEEIVIQPLYESVSDFENGLARVEKDGLFGLIDGSGELIEAIRFSMIRKLETNHFLVIENGLYGLMDENGEIIVSPKYEDIIDVGNGELIVAKNGLYGIIETSGVSLLPARYKIIKYDSFSDSYLIAKNPKPETIKK